MGPWQALLHGADSRVCLHMYQKRLFLACASSVVSKLGVVELCLFNLWLAFHWYFEILVGWKSCLHPDKSIILLERERERECISLQISKCP